MLTHSASLTLLLLRTSAWTSLLCLPPCGSPHWCSGPEPRPRGKRTGPRRCSSVSSCLLTAGPAGGSIRPEGGSRTTTGNDVQQGKTETIKQQRALLSFSVKRYLHFFIADWFLVFKRHGEQSVEHFPEQIRSVLTLREHVYVQPESILASESASK